ncbi:MAG: fimbria/pilus periplasmic chaperone [Cupriavidus sp.]|nr:fimbria/pilus periplasmic chaperone [Cupriavidus sp.]
MSVWKYIVSLLALCVALAATSAQAAIVITGTRVIYPEKSRQVNVRLTNVDSKPVLVQAWIDDGDTSIPVNDIRVPFVLTPAVFRVESKKGQTLRIKFTGQEMPADRESVYWLNVLEISPKPEGAEDQNMLQLAFATRIKLFYRPLSLRDDPTSARGKLRWTVRNAEGKHVLRVENPSGYYLSLDSVSVKAGDRETTYQPQMVPPFGHVDLSIQSDGAAASAGSDISYTVLNDFGAAVRDVARTE